MNKTDKKNDPKPSDYKKQADALLESGIDKRERYLEALPLIFILREAATTVSAFAAALKESADKLGEAAATYAKEHTTALDDGGLHEVKGGKLSGSIRVKDNEYTLTLGSGDIKRTSGDNLTALFLSKLPKEWIRSKPKLNTSEINRLGVTDAQLLKYGLFRSESRIWSRKAISGSVAGIESAVTPNPEPGNEEAES